VTAFNQRFTDEAILVLGFRCLITNPFEKKNLLILLQIFSRAGNE